MKMKKNDWLLAGAVAAYSYLFYEQSAGINYLIFTIMLLVLILAQTRSWVFRQRAWQLVVFTSLLSALDVVLVNSGLAVLENIISLILLAGFSNMPQTSIFIAALNSLYSLTTSLFNFTFYRKRYFPESSGRILSFAGINLQQVSMVVIPMAVTGVFLAIYCSASATFSNLVGEVDLSFISIPWVLFTFVGFWMMFGFFRQQLLQKITESDLMTGNNLERIRRKCNQVVKVMGLKYEFKTGFILLILLNVLLLAFNLNDAYYLTIGDLPEEIPYSEFLHQGVNMLIFSIVLAIAVLLYLFRGNLNFFSKNKPLKFLAYAWLAQNLILVILTLTKNSIYVADFGLTYKRIGVYTYLTLTAIGLIISFIKVAEVRNNWFLFRRNAWALYLILVCLSSVNWDRVLTNYNLNYAKAPDLYYLLTLSDSNLPLLQKSTAMNNLPNISKAIVRRTSFSLERIAAQDWQSWNYNDYLILKELNENE
jgi:hypothetical protein